jgi:hypothetical protein
MKDDLNSLQCILKSTKLAGLHRKSYYAALLDNIKNHTTFLPDTATLQERVYVILNNINSIPLCPNCNNEVKFGWVSNEDGYGYRKTCSISCFNKLKGREIYRSNRIIHEQKFCKTCKSPTKYYNKTNKRNAGYADYCSAKCNMASIETNKKRQLSKRSNLSQRKIQLNKWMRENAKTELSIAKLSQVFPNYNRTYLRNILTRSNIKFKKFESFYEIKWKSILEDSTKLTWSKKRKILDRYEIDLFNEEYNVGLEIHGDYFHSTKFRTNKKYHQNKFNISIHRGIKLIQLFTHELEESPEICKSIILANVGIIDKKYDARKCNIVQIKAKDANAFYRNNHLQGAINNKSQHIALVFGDEIVSCISIGDMRYGKDKGVEIYRFANKIHTQCRGGFSKLLSYYIKNNTYCGDIYSFSDCRISTGNLYKIYGFQLIRQTSPGFFYINGTERKSRTTLQKHKQEKIFDNFDANLTEEENANNNGYYRVYDAGNFLWKFTVTP